MQESQYESNSNRSAPDGAGGIVATVIRWGGAVVSVALALGIVYWAVMLGQRDASKVPVIRAMEGAARIAPDNPGGTQAEYQGLAVNEVLAENTPSVVETETILAPQEQTVQPEDSAMGTLQAEPETVEEPLRVDASSMLVEVDQNGQPVPDTPPLSVAPDGMVMPTRRPENFLGSEPDESGVIDNLLQQLLPEEGDTSLDVPELPTATPLFGNPQIDLGAPLVQLGAFGSLDIASAAWDQYQTRHGDLLVGMQRVIEPAEAGGRLLYQLRAAGLVDVDAARSLCLALNARGADCLAVTQK